MPRKIKIYSLALRDIENGQDYYEAQKKGLGKRFEKLVNTTLREIRKFPFSASFAYEDVRYKVLKRFPYIVLYTFDDANIYILRVFNTHQEPLY